MLLASLLMLSCTPQPEVFVVDSHEVSVELINPTLADPFDGVEVFRLEIENLDGMKLLEEEWASGDSFEMPSLDIYGVVRFVLTGLSLTGETLSLGRSAPIALTPRVERIVPITFVPINEVLPLKSEMGTRRALHATETLPDGRVVIFGGIDADEMESTGAIEYYDSETGGFIPSLSHLGYTVYSPTWDINDDGEIVVAGGASYTNDTLAPQRTTVSFDPIRDQVSQLPNMYKPRHGHCFQFLWESFGVAIGGGAISSTDYDESMYYRMETLRPETGTGTWEWTDFDFSTAQYFYTIETQECVALDDGRLFITGWDHFSTGVLDYPNDGSHLPAHLEMIDPDAQDSSLMKFLTGPTLIPRDHSVLMIGGAHYNVQTGWQMASSPTEFDLDSRRFITTADLDLEPRIFGSIDEWIDPDTFVVGCGYRDVGASQFQKSLEIVDLTIGGRRIELELDQIRSGCRVNAMPDGAILVTGGYQSGPSASIVVPWFE